MTRDRIFKAAVVACAAAAAGYAIEQAIEARNRRRFPPPGRLVDVGGFRLHLHCAGTRRPGQPTVILESGIGAWSLYWQAFQPQVAAFARTCAYDRAGSGWSDPGPQPRSPRRMAAELHALLAAAGESGPYLLVGHSLGGLILRQFARQYPEEVAGMVLIDAVHDRIDRYIPFLASSYRSFLVGLRGAGLLARLGAARLLGRRGLLLAHPPILERWVEGALTAQTLHPRFFAALSAEASGWAGFTAGANPPSLGKLPLVVVHGLYPETPPAGYPRAIWKRFTAGWNAMQADLAGLSTRSRRVAIGQSHHPVYDAPDLVLEIVRELVDLTTLVDAASE